MVSSKKSYHHGNLRSQLIKAALQAIESRGRVEFNLRELAQVCGVSVAALYRHFDSKNQLLIELAGHGFTQLATLYQGIMAHSDYTPAERLAALGLAYVRFAMENEGLFRVMFSRELCLIPEFAQISEVAEQSLAILNRALAGETEQQPSKLSPQTLDAWARVHGLAYLWLDQNIELSQTEFLENVQLILNQPKRL